MSVDRPASPSPRNRPNTNCANLVAGRQRKVDAMAEHHRRILLVDEDVNVRRMANAFVTMHAPSQQMTSVIDGLCGLMARSSDPDNIVFTLSSLQEEREILMPRMIHLLEHPARRVVKGEKSVLSNLFGDTSPAVPHVARVFLRCFDAPDPPTDFELWEGSSEKRHMLDTVCRLLSHTTTDRQDAAAEFVTLVGPALLPTLLPALRDDRYRGPPSHGIHAVLEFLQASGTDAAAASAPTVAKLIENGDCHVRKHECDVLVEWKSEASTDIPVYRQLFHTTDQDTCEKVTYANIFLGAQEGALEINACSLLIDASPKITKSCLEILEQIDVVSYSTCAAIAKKFGDEDADVRRFED